MLDEQDGNDDDDNDDDDDDDDAKRVMYLGQGLFQLHRLQGHTRLTCHS